jgi:hypothetical protein
MSQYVMVADLGEKVVVTDAPEHPEPRPVPGAVARPWNACTIPGCTHGPCPAKLRAWASYGSRYMCDEVGCDHRDCPPRKRATEDHQPFAISYDGPALPQHVVDMDGVPLGEPMIAVKDEAGEWSLWPAGDLDD